MPSSLIGVPHDPVQHPEECSEEYVSSWPTFEVEFLFYSNVALYTFLISFMNFFVWVYIYIYINIVIFLTQFEGGLCTSCFKIGFLHAIAATALPCLNFFPHVLSNICFVIFLYDPLFSQSFFSFLSRSHYLLCLLRENVSESDVV